MRVRSDESVSVRAGYAASLRWIKSTTFGHVLSRYPPSAWNVSWNGARANPSAASAIRAMTHAIGAASALGSEGRTSCKRQVGSFVYRPVSLRDDLLSHLLWLWLKVFLGEETLYRQSVAIEVDGKRWVPVPDSTATAEEFIAALSLLHEIHQQSRWSPWAMQDRADEYDAALKVCGQWTSAEPESPGKTLEDYEAELDRREAEADARFLAAEAQAENDRAERVKHYDQDRAQARLALLEEQGILDSKVRERDEILSGELFRCAPEKERK
jgi:hypothetical protein